MTKFLLPRFIEVKKYFLYDYLSLENTGIFDLTLTSSLIFSAFQVAPAGELYEEEFFSLVASLESHSQHPLGASVLSVAKKNNVQIRQVIGYNEFPGMGIGGAVEVGAGVYRATVIGTRKFLNECGLNVPEILEVAIRKWESEGYIVVLAGWDGWVRGILKFARQSISQ